VPLAALALVTRRAARTRHVLALPPRRRRSLIVPVAAMVLAAVLLGLAAAQPVLARETRLHVRTDAEVFVAVDVSRSMLARQTQNGPTRLGRARALAVRLREELPGVRVGVASITDRVLPHLFPTADDDVFRTTLYRSVDIEQPPPRSQYSVNATSFDTLTDVATRRFFAPTAKRRVLVVLTDGESIPITAARIGRVFARPPAIKTVFVHVWNENEHVYGTSGPEPQYHTDPSSRAILEALSVATGGAVYPESQIEAAATQARKFVGSGPTEAEGVRDNRNGMAPYLALAALLPLGLLLTRQDR
jgi:VWA domain-containing protein